MPAKLQERERADLQEDIPSTVRSIHDLRQIYYKGKLGLTSGSRSDNELIRAWLISQTGLTNKYSTRDLWVTYMTANGVSYSPSLGDMMKTFFGDPSLASGGNPGVSTPTLQVASGSFTGNGTSQAITGLGFSPDLVIIHDDSATASIRTSWRSKSMTGDKTASTVGQIANFANGITSLDADGFTVGSANDVNENTKTIRWIAFKDNGSNTLAWGKYTGNGTAQSITGLNFQPDMVFAKVDSTGARGCFTTSTPAANTTFACLNAASFTGGFTTLDSDGFTVGSDSRVNTNASDYYWFAFKQVAGQFKVGSYTTTASPSDNRSITGVGFQPDMVIIRSSDSNDNPALRMPGLSGDLSYVQFGGVSSANNIQAMEADGFQVGTANVVQRASSTFYYMAWKDL